MNIEMKNLVMELLAGYHDRKREIALLEYELAHPTKVTGDEMIGAMNFAHRDAPGHAKGHVSNKTFYIALNYQEQAERFNVETFTEIYAHLTDLKQEQERLDYYISLLEPRQKQILVRTYIECVSNEDAAKEIGISVRRLQEVKAKAVESLAEMYELTAGLR